MTPLYHILRYGPWSDRLTVAALFLLLIGGWAVGYAGYCIFFGGR